MTEKQQDPLDELFLTDEQSKWFNKGKESGRVGERLRNKPLRKNLSFDENRLKFKFEEMSKQIKDLLEQRNYWKNRSNRMENKLCSIFEVLKGIISKKIYNKAYRIWISSSNKYNECGPSSSNTTQENKE